MTFLIRPRPLEGESLSSWRHRLGLSNGFRLFPLAPGEPRRSDTDLAPQAKTVQWLSQQTGLPVQLLLQLSLKSQRAVLHDADVGGGQPRWILPLRYTRAEDKRGMPFCPKCLEDDTEPYFRLHWRVYLSNACVKHQVLYCDRCPRCRAAAWPGSICDASVYRRVWAPCHICPHCGADLREARSTEAIAPHTPVWPTTAEFIKLSADKTVPLKQFANAMWCLASLFLHKRQRTALLRVGGTAAYLAEGIAAEKTSAFQALPIHLRHEITTITERLLSGWPGSAVKFCRANRLSAEHFNACAHIMPEWFKTDLIVPIRKQVRGVTFQDIEWATRQLRRNEQKVSKAAVAKLLGVVSSTALTQTMRKRRTATAPEWVYLQESLQTRMAQKPNRRSSQETVVRDVVLLLGAALMKCQLKDISALTVDAWQEALDNLTRSCIAPPTIMLHEANAAYEKLSRARRGTCPSADPFFLGLRGNADIARSARELLFSAMRPLDPALQRSIAVFWPLAH